MDTSDSLHLLGMLSSRLFIRSCRKVAMDSLDNVIIQFIGIYQVFSPVLSSLRCHSYAQGVCSWRRYRTDVSDGRYWCNSIRSQSLISHPEADISPSWVSRFEYTLKTHSLTRSYFNASLLDSDQIFDILSKAVDQDIYIREFVIVLQMAWPLNRSVLEKVQQHTSDITPPASSGFFITSSIQNMFENRTIARPVFRSKCDITPSQTCGRKLKKPSQFSEISLCHGKDSARIWHISLFARIQ